MKRLFIPALIAGLMFIASCRQAETTSQSGGYTVSGTMADGGSPMVYLSYSDSASEITDSAKVTGGKFSFTGKLPQPTMAFIWTGQNRDRGNVLSFFLSDTAMSIELRNDTAANSKVSSTPEQDTYREYLLLRKPLMERMMMLQNAAQLLALKENDNNKARNKVAYDSLADIYRQVYEQSNEALISFVKAHPASIVSAWAVTNSQFMYGGDVEKLKMLYALFTPAVQKSGYASRIKGLIAMREKVAIGNSAPDFTANDTAGKPVTLSSFRGKYLLLDFWASWCHPCRGENPNVVKAFKMFRDKDFTILQVSLDDSKQAWLNAIHDDNLVWNHVSDLKGWSSPVAVQFGIQSIPSNFLLDKAGKIIAHDLRGEALQDTLASVLK